MLDQKNLTKISVDMVWTELMGVSKQIYKEMSTENQGMDQISCIQPMYMIRCMFNAYGLIAQLYLSLVVMMKHIHYSSWN